MRIRVVPANGKLSRDRPGIFRSSPEHGFSMRYLVLLLVLFLTACPVREVDVCGPDVEDPHPDCPESDAGIDQNNGLTPDSDADGEEEPDTDTGACSPACTDEMVCNETTGECVECLAEGDCTDQVCSRDTNTCVECLGDDDCTDGVCDTDANTCVVCLTNDDCTDPTASFCDTDTNTCSGCTTSADCAHLADAGTGVCDTENSTCVECLDDDETTRAACDGNSCDPATNTCTDTVVGSLEVCEPCLADSECSTDHSCVPMDFDGAFHGNYCLKLLASGCERPFSDSIDAVSASGNQTEEYCALKTSLVTCEAFNTFLDACEDASECGDANLNNDARCEPVDTIAGNECTFACVGMNDCPQGSDCTGGVEGDRWCE